MSGYPPGVSGREWQIAGPDREEEAVRTCPQCGRQGVVTIELYGDEAEWTCPPAIPEHEASPSGLRGRFPDGAWGTVGWCCLICSEKCSGPSDRTAHPAQPGCGARYRG